MQDRKPTILAVDDKVENLDILSALLEDYDVRDVTDGASALQLLKENTVDLILLDIMMPVMDGFELCQRIQHKEEFRQIPIIFISAISDEQAIERAFEVGGKDYVTKPFRPRELLARVKTQIELKFMMERLQFLAFHDSLTGIYNRRRFFELAEHLFGTREDLHAVILDIDHFKNINDRFGHGIGDETLRQVVSAVRDRLPPEAVFGRLGGEEFGMLFPGYDTASLFSLVDTLREAVSHLIIPTPQGPIQCHISCGIAVREPGLRNIDELLHHADEALYEAKGSGRNRVIFRNIEGRSAPREG